MVGRTRENAEAERNRATIVYYSLINQIEEYIETHSKDEYFFDNLFDKYNQPVNVMIEKLKEEHERYNNTSSIISFLKDFWTLGNLITEKFPDEPHEPFFVHVGSESGMKYTWSFTKEDFKEFELDYQEIYETEFYKVFENEADDVEMSEYPLAVMIGRIEDSFNIMKNKKAE